MHWQANSLSLHHLGSTMCVYVCVYIYINIYMCLCECVFSNPHHKRQDYEDKSLSVGNYHDRKWGGGMSLVVQWLGL